MRTWKAVAVLVLALAIIFCIARLTDVGLHKKPHHIIDPGSVQESD